MRLRLSESQIFRSAQRTTGSGFGSDIKTNEGEDTFKSPAVKQFSSQNPNTPAAQLKVTPEIEEYQFSESSGTDKKYLGNVEYRNLTLE
mgnify:CR=1 FL=1